MQSIVNKVKLIKMYSIPQIFDTIVFKDGLNMIIGEKCEDSSPSGQKTNGVGKSICIEFINFCFLKDYDKSRISKIPPTILSDDIEIILELEVNKEKLVIRRSIKKPDNPIIKFRGEEQEFKDIKEACSFMESIIYINNSSIIIPSYRELISSLMREETSGFNNIINYFDATKKIPDNPKPLLYMLQIDLYEYIQINNVIIDIDNTGKRISELKKKLTNNNTIKIDEIRAELNAMNDQVEKMEEAIEDAKSNKAFESIQKDLITLENTMDELRVKQKAIRYEMQKIKSLPETEKIDSNEVKIMYNFFKEGLGEIVSKSLDEVIGFKEKIENYQNKLINEKYFELERKNKEVTEVLNKYDDEYSSKIKLIDNKGTLKNLKNSIKIYTEKNKELSEKNQKIKLLDEEEAHLKMKRNEKSTDIIELDKEIQAHSDILKAFQETIYDVHQEIMENRKCYFELGTKESGKKILQIIFRIDADGSFSVDRTKVFLYDVSLLLNKETSKRHPGFLIHDNIFLVDQDTLIKSLNFLYKQGQIQSDFQYIMTLNRDTIQNEEEKLNFKLEDCTIASYTKDNKFLKKDYQELK